MEQNGFEKWEAYVRSLWDAAQKCTTGAEYKQAMDKYDKAKVELAMARQSAYLARIKGAEYMMNGGN